MDKHDMKEISCKFCDHKSLHYCNNDNVRVSKNIKHLHMIEGILKNWKFYEKLGYVHRSNKNTIKSILYKTNWDLIHFTYKDKSITKRVNDNIVYDYYETRKIMENYSKVNALVKNS